VSNADFARYDAYNNSGVEWLGEVPSSWFLNRHKDNFTFVTDRCVNSSLEKIGLENIEGKTGRFITTESEFDGDGVEFKENDILFGKLRPYLAKVYLSQFCGNAVGDIFVYRPKGNTAPKFAQYLMLSDIYIDVINSSTAGAKMPRVSPIFIANLPIATPPLPEQTTIAAYLDTKTAQIDRKIDLLTQKATQYGKLKQSLINETVTRGLDKTVAMKDSGVEWIGEVPEHWDIYRIKDHTYVKGRIGWQGLRNSDFLYDGDFYCVTGTDLKNGVVDWSNCYYVPENRYEQDKFIQLKVNDLLITKDGTIGKVALVYELPKKSTLNSGVFVTRPFRGTYTNEYMHWILCSSMFRNYIDLTKGGSTIHHLYQNVFERFSYSCPSLPEQKAIADYLDTKTAHIDLIIETINTQIGKLKELRKTLINDVVTGKIKVA